MVRDEAQTRAAGSTDYFAVSPQETLEALGVSNEGLTQEQAGQRLQRFGPNALAPAKRKPAILRFLAHFDDVLIYILLASAGLKAIIGDWVDFTVILVAAVAIALIGFIQEGQAEDALAGIRKMLSLEAQVLRGGKWVNEDATLLVPGDIVRVKSGDRVPADMRILESTNLRVDEAALTGESEPAEKDSRAVSADAGVGDRSSMLFSSTILTGGTATAVVTATGASTEIGRISTMVEDVEEMDTPLARNLAELGKKLSLGIAGLVVVMLVVGRLVHNWPVDELISAAIGFAVAAVPEGLPALVTITLALGVKEMAKSNAITRKLASVETLGSVTTICSDKTGTLTQNEMTAKVGLTRDQRFTVSGGGYAPEGEVAVEGGGQVGNSVALVDLIQSAAMTSNAQVEEGPEGWRVVGAPTEGALTVLARKAKRGKTGTRLAELPFDSENKFSASLDLMPGGERVVHVLGAPDRLLQRSNTELDASGTEHALELPAWEAKNDELSADGLRVLAVAKKTRDVPDADQIVLEDIDDLTFLGVVGIVDPPRPEAVAAIEEAHGAGITVKMITGDHAGTALAIAKELGLAQPESTDVITGSELEQMSQDELRHRVNDVNVFARTSPEHKIRIVRALQSGGQVVAMTGDGVNDAPSITRADVGLAMGIKGTEATKDAADIVLADDNFATIEKAVEEGRRIFDNIRKSLVFLLPTNGAQSLVILLAVLFGWTLPLSPVQILWINLVTAVTLSLPLAAEPAEPGIMSRAPRSPKESILPRRFVYLVVLTSALIAAFTLWVFQYASGHGYDLAVAQTASVTMLAFAQLAFLFSSRFLTASSVSLRALTGNRLIWISIVAMVALQLVFVYAPFMHHWFGSAALSGRAWLAIVGLAFAMFLIVEAVKGAGRLTQKAKQSRATSGS